MNETIDRLLPEIVALRHELHEHPEIRFEEHWTSDRLARFLDKTGVTYQRGLAKGTGIMATVKGRGDTVVALRADIDGLEVEEETGLPYASKVPGRMHACGHDGHMAIACGALKVLHEHRDELAGSVRFLFQPGEEIGAGARFMVQDGAVEGVNAIFGLHGSPELAAGQMGIRSGWCMASADMFTIDITGRGCHGAEPAAGVDPVVTAAHIITALQTIVGREIEPTEPSVVTVASVHAGDASNIIPSKARMTGTLRAFRPDVFQSIRDGVVRIAKHTAEAHRATADVRFSAAEPYPALYNDEALTEFARKVGCDVAGPENVIGLDKPVMVSEDFAYYAQKVPGAFFFLGVNPEPGTPYPALHTSRYDFTDEALRPGIRLMTALAARFLEESKYEVH